MSEWQWQIVDIAIVLFESVFLYYWYFSEKFEFRLYGIKRCLLMSLFPITTFILDIAVKNVPSMKLIILLGVGIFSVYVIYKCNILQDVLWNVFFMFLLIVSESVSMGFLLFIHGEGHISMFLEHSFLRIQCLILSKLINVVFIVVCVKILKPERKKYTLKEVGVLLLQAFSSILCLIMIVELSYYQKEHVSWNMLLLVFLGIAVLISYIVAYYFTDQYFFYRDREKEIVMIEMRNEKMLNNYKRLEDGQQRVYQLYHDLKKHLNLVNMMENNSDVNEYLKKCFEGIQDMEGKFQTGNRYIDMILYDEWRKAYEQGITVQFAVGEVSLEKIELQDIIIILGNALENAREACKKKIENDGKAHMQLKIMKMTNQVFVIISNSYVGEISRKDNVFITSKQDTTLHGIGMKSIRSSVEKYQGEMDVSIKENKFILKIMLIVNGVNRSSI